MNLPGGRFSRTQICSRHLAQSRAATVFMPNGNKAIDHLPVIYCADGQMVPRLCSRLHDEITTGSTPPVVLVGVHSDPDARNEEYLAGLDEPRFRIHQRFFIEEVPAWAEAELGVSPDGHRRAVFGVSNGGAFAVTIGLTHPERYGAVVGFSVPRPPAGFPDPRAGDENLPKFYFAAGNRGAEKPFAKFTRALSNRLQRHGVDVAFFRGDGDHEPQLWQNLFSAAIHWLTDVDRDTHTTLYEIEG